MLANNTYTKPTTSIGARQQLLVHGKGTTERTNANGRLQIDEYIDGTPQLL